MPAATPLNIEQEKYLSWHQVPESYLQDLNCIFEEIILGETFAEIRLRNHSGNDIMKSIKWQQKSNNTQVSMQQSVLTTPELSKLTTQDKKDIWQLIHQST